jgi:hypothetical protein
MKAELICTVLDSSCVVSTDENGRIVLTFTTDFPESDYAEVIDLLHIDEIDTFSEISSTIMREAFVTSLKLS